MADKSATDLRLAVKAAKDAEKIAKNASKEAEDALTELMGAVIVSLPEALTRAINDGIDNDTDLQELLLARYPEQTSQTLSSATRSATPECVGAILKWLNAAYG